MIGMNWPEIPMSTPRGSQNGTSRMRKNSAYATEEKVDRMTFETT